MGRARPVTWAGRARSTATITVVTATAAVLLAGCGARIADQSARGRPGPTATVGSPGGAEPAAGSRARAQSLARRMLSRLILPHGARPVRMRVLPPLLRQPEIPDGGTHEADVHGLFLLSEPMSAVRSFLEAHLPTGMRGSGDGQSAGSSGITMESLSFEPRMLAAGINGAELDTAVVPAAGGGSLLRADAAVIWYPARSAAEQIDPGRYRAAVVSITLFNPRQHTVRRTITSGGIIARLAGLANGLHAAPYQPANCPAIVAGYRITFVPADRPAPQVVVTPSGCMTVGVTVAGAAQPPLWGDTGLIRAASRLLHIEP
jgi:hypothetical protein